MSTVDAEDHFEGPKAKRLKTELDSARKWALQRWKILKQAIISGRSSALTSSSSASVRRFSSFGLLQTKRLPHQKDECVLDGDWFLYSSSDWPDFKMTIRHLPGLIKPETLLGFNNTGNVCVWPSEEVLTNFCLKNLDMFSQKDVIELGGGMTCLAGIALSVQTDVKTVVVSDGNEESVTNLDAIIKKNSEQFSDTNVSSRLVRWGSTPIDEADLKERFDIVLCADCLFFDDGRQDLVDTVYKLLRSQFNALMSTNDEALLINLAKTSKSALEAHQTFGEAIMFAPKRCDTFDKFVTLAADRFEIDVTENYDTKVWDMHCKMKSKGIEHYDPNIHYPWCIRMKKLPESRESSSER